MQLHKNLWGSKCISMKKKWMWFVAAGAIVAGALYVATMTKDSGVQVGAVKQALAKGFSVSLDAASPVQSAAIGSSQEITVTVLSLQSNVDEALSLRQLAFQFNGSNLAALKKFTVWAGSTKIGEGVFPGKSATTTVVFSPITIPQGGRITLELKADLAPIDPTQPTKSGDTIAINYDGQGWRESQAVGLSSAKLMVSATRRDTKAKPVTIFKSVPTVKAVLPVFAPPLTGSNISGTFPLHRFEISAHPAGDIGIGKLTFQVKTSGPVKIGNFKLWSFSDSSFSFPYPDTTEIKQTGRTVEVYFKNVFGIPAGAVRFFELRGDVTRKKEGGKIAATLEGDKKSSGVGTFATVDVHRENDFIWSDSSTELGNFGNFDAEQWSNGYAIKGLPAAGLPALLTDEPQLPIPSAPDKAGLNVKCQGVVINPSNDGALAVLNWSRPKDTTFVRIRVNDQASDDPPRVSDDNCADMRPGDFCTNWGAHESTSYMHEVIKDHTYEWWLEACNKSGCSDPVKAPKTFVCRGEVSPAPLPPPPPGSIIK